MRMRELSHTLVHWMRSKFSKVTKCLSPPKKNIFYFYYYLFKTCAKSKEQRMVAIILFHFLSFRVFFSEEPGCTFGDTKHYMG